MKIELRVLSLALMIVFTFAATADAQLLLHYDFEQTGSTATDQSPNGNDGALTGTTQVAGVFGNGRHFNVGNADFLGLTSGTNLPGSDDTYTVLGWFKSDWLSPAGGGHILGYNLNGLKMTWGVHPADQLWVSYQNGGGRQLPVGNLDVNAYQHFAMTYDPNGLTNIFVNGSAATYDTGAPHKFFGGPDNGDVGLSLGAVNPFEGGAPQEGQSVSIDDFAIYGGALSQSQIQGYMANGVPEPTTLTLLALGMSLFLGTHRRYKRQ